MRQLFHYIGVRPAGFPPGNDAQAERTRIAHLSTLSSAMGRFVAMLTMLLSIHLTIPYLGLERFGVWMVLVTFTAMLSFSDLGFGSALLNRLAQARLQSREEVVRVLSTGLFAVALICLATTLLLVFAHQFVDWKNLWKIDNSVQDRELQDSLFAFYVLFGFFQFSNTLMRCFQGLQKAHQANLIACCFYILAIPALLVMARFEMGIPWLLGITLGPVILTGMLLMALLIKDEFLQVRAVRSNLDEIPRLFLASGGYFFLYQLANLMSWGADAFLISSTLGVASVALYSVVNRVFQLVLQPLGLFNQSFWPAYVDARHANQPQYIAEVFKKLLGLSFLIGLFASIFLAIFTPYILPYFSNGLVSVSPAFLWLYALWIVFEVTALCVVVYLGAMGCERFLAAIHLIFVAVSLPLKLIFLPEYGLESMVVVNLVCFLTFIALPFFILKRKNHFNDEN